MGWQRLGLGRKSTGLVNLMAGRPVVGVTASVRGGRLMWQFNRLAIWRAGGRAKRITSRRVVSVRALDALIIGGGDDIGAELYRGEVAVDIRIDPARDRLELGMLKDALRRGMPVLGICRGAQMINIVNGGSLHEDIYAVYEEAPRMRTVLPRKSVNIKRGSRLHKILRLSLCRVNALHHQSVDRIGRGLSVVAEDGHGIIQAVEAGGKTFLLGVQWHPEFLVLSRPQQRIFRALVSASRRNRT